MLLVTVFMLIQFHFRVVENQSVCMTTNVINETVPIPSWLDCIQTGRNCNSSVSIPQTRNRTTNTEVCCKDYETISRGACMEPSCNISSKCPLKNNCYIFNQTLYFCKRNISCINGELNSSNECSCNPGYMKDPNDNYKCISTCLSNCKNGECYNNECLCNPKFIKRNGSLYDCVCKPGYILQFKRCVPRCMNCTNGICIKPGVCSCKNGFKPINNNSSCIPICTPKCTNGQCISNNRCKCNRGYNHQLKEPNNCIKECGSNCSEKYCNLKTCQCFQQYYFSNYVDQDCLIPANDTVDNVCKCVYTQEELYYISCQLHCKAIMNELKATDSFLYTSDYIEEHNLFKIAGITLIILFILTGFLVYFNHCKRTNACN